MRIVTKINLALVGVVAVSAALNYAALNLTVMPSFLGLESQSATRNQERALEAIQLHKTQVGSSAGDYAFWDDTYGFMTGGAPEYLEKNVNPESLQALGVNYFALIDVNGKVVLDTGYISADDPAEIQLLNEDALHRDNVLVKAAVNSEAASGLLRTSLGLAAVGYAPILRSDRSGPPVGTLVMGRLLNVDDLKSSTKVDFEILAEGAQVRSVSGAVELKTGLLDINGSPVGTLVSRTPRVISAAGAGAIWAAMGLLAFTSALLIIVLALVLRRIALQRIEKMRAHLLTIASTGELRPMPEDRADDELSETLLSFNLMAAQLVDLREKLRRKDYQHGAAEQAAGILHNVRNAMSPISTMAWALSRKDGSNLENLAKALDELGQPDVSIQRAARLNNYVALAATQMLKDDEARRSDVGSMASMLHHVQSVLKDYDLVSQGDRPKEVVDLEACVRDAANLVRRRAEVTVEVTDASPPQAFASKTTVEQILANLVTNAAESIEANGLAGRVTMTLESAELGGVPAAKIVVSDTGEGVDPSMLGRLFERGYSTRRDRIGGLGLHWCSNAANEMGGRLYAESRGTGQGATFHLLLPTPADQMESAA